MRMVKFDETGVMRCQKCGGSEFKMKRTFRSKLAVGVGALLTKKKAKCLKCGKFNDTK